MSSKIESVKLSFRIARATDADEITELVQLAYRGGKATVDWKNESHLVEGPRINSDEVISIIQKEVSEILLVESDGKIIGCVKVEKLGDDASIGLLAVNPDYQNIGLGRRLVQKAESFAIEEFYCKTASMTVLSGRDELLNWYLSLGYRLTGVSMAFECGLQRVKIENPHFREIRKPLVSV